MAGVILNRGKPASNIFLKRTLRVRFKKIFGFGFSRIWYNEE